MKVKITEEQLNKLIRESLEEIGCKEGLGLYQVQGRNLQDQLGNDAEAKRRALHTEYGDINSMGCGLDECGDIDSMPLDEEATDEGVLGGIRGAAKGFGQAVRGELNKFKRGAMDTGLHNEYDGQTLKDRVKTAGAQIKTAFRGGDIQQELSNIEKALLKLNDKTTFGGSPVLRSPQQYEAFNTLLNAVKMAKMGSVGGVNSAASKRYGAPVKPEKTTNTVNRGIAAESKIDEAVKKSIKKVLK